MPSRKEMVYEAALQYASIGLPIFPIRENDKRPHTRRGFYDATIEKAQLESWFNSSDVRVYNLAACPDDFGCFVVDCDGREGAISWATFAVMFGVKAGLIIETPSGGQHHWFKGQLPSSVRKIAPGIDIRGIGGYVLLPPSEINSRGYRIVSGSWQEIAQAPAGLYEYLQGRYEKSEYARLPEGEYDMDAAQDWCRRYVERCIKRGQLPEFGNRNQYATSFFICMYTHGVTQEFAREMMEFIYDAGGARPDQNPDPGIESIIERTWAGKMKCNPAGSELPPGASQQFGDPTQILAAINSPIKLQWGNQTTPRPVEWYWKGWLAKGKIHLLAGEPGTGKSTLALKILATITRGGVWPDLTAAPRGRVLVWSGEDNWEDTLLPRFLACGGDPERIANLGRIDDEGGGGERAFHPGRDMDRLILTAKTIKDLRVIVIDPIVVAASSKQNTHNNVEIRDAMLPLYDFCERTGVSVIGITHFTKGTMGRDPSSRVTGSLAWGAMSRVVLAAGKSEDGTKRRCVRAKSNIGPDGGGFDYTLGRDDEERQFITWGQYQDGNPRDLLGELEPPKEKGRPDTERQDAILWLRTLLANAPNNEVPSKDLWDQAKLNGFAEATVKRAMRACKDVLCATPTRPTESRWAYRLVSPA